MSYYCGDVGALFILVGEEEMYHAPSAVMRRAWDSTMLGLSCDIGWMWKCGNYSTKATRRLTHSQKMTEKRLPFNYVGNRRI